MTTFALVAGICGVLAFLILCLQGALLLRKETQRLFTPDWARSLAIAKGACDKRHLSYEDIGGTVPGIIVTGRAYKVRSLRREGESQGWAAAVAVGSSVPPEHR